MKRLLSLALAFTMLTTFATAESESSKIKARIAGLMEAWNSGDYEKTLTFYDKDVQAILEGAAPIKGHEAFGKVLAEEVPLYTPLTMETHTLKVHGGYAYETGLGSYVYEGGNGEKITGHSDYVNVWKKDENGVWNLQIEIWWSSESDPEKDKAVLKEIKKRVATMTAAWNHGDYAGYLSVYSDDFIVIAQEEDPLTDRNAYRKQLAEEVGTYTNIKYDTTTIKAQGKFAFEIGVDAYDYEGENGETITGNDNYMVIWKKDAHGVWNMYVDVFWGAEEEE